MKQIKEFTQKQIDRLPNEGYWLSYFKSNNPSIMKNLGERPSAYCIKNGMIKYIHSMWGNEWCTLLWTCMNTKRQILKDNESKMLSGDSYEGSYHEHYDTHDEMIKAHPELDSAFQKKAPNDF